MEERLIENSGKAYSNIAKNFVHNGMFRYFRDQPGLSHPSLSNQHLIAWYYEDWLKKYFFSILQILEVRQ